MEKEWKKFRDIVKKYINNICGVTRVGGQRINCSELGSEEVCVSVTEKRRALKARLQR